MMSKKTIRITCLIVAGTMAFSLIAGGVAMFLQ